MTSYLKNFKWLVANQEEYNSSIKSPDKFEIIEKHKELEYDFGSENHNLSNQSNMQDIISQYNSIHLEMNKKEQLIKERLDSDTIDKIKSNYSDYINNDIKIIKDFAIIMDTFTHIQNKLKEVETGIKKFESNITTKSLNQDISNQEFKDKIQQIDIKFDNSIKFIQEIKVNNNVLMEKIIKLENIINTNDIKGHKILLGLEKISIINNKDNDDKKVNNLINWFNIFQSSKYNFNNILMIRVLTGSCIAGIYFSIKYISRK